MTTTTINGLIKLAKDECARVAKLKDVRYSPTMKTAIESALEMVITKSRDGLHNPCHSAS